MTKVFCIILNFNKPEDTMSCLRSLNQSDLPSGSPLLVVDNGPRDNKEYFAKEISSVIYLKNDRNLGFAAGNNVGIREALRQKADYILIINPDVTVPRRFFAPLLKTFEKMGEEGGLIAPAITEGKGTYSLGGTVDWRKCAFPIDHARDLPDMPQKYDHVTFACLLIKADVFRKVGLLDERYFMYLEDVDYCVAAASAGYQALVDPSVVVTHKTSSSYSDPRIKIRMSLRSAIAFINKWYQFPENAAPFVYILFFYLKEYVVWSLRLMKRSILK